MRIPEISSALADSHDFGDIGRGVGGTPIA
jgi:hypothetical protein